MKIYGTLFLLIALCFSACQPYNPPRPASQSDSIYVAAHAKYFGTYYPNVKQGVVSLDLLTKGLTFDSLYRISGTGLNMYLSDIFIPAADSILPEGTYYMDTTANPFTFLPGMQFDGTVSGCYLLEISQTSVTKIILMSSGTMDVHYNADSVFVDINLRGSDSIHYAAHYRDILEYDR